MGIYTKTFSKVPALMKDRETLQDLAARRFDWIYYDENFGFTRQVQHASLSWSAITGSCGCMHAQSNQNFRPKHSQLEPSRLFSSNAQIPQGYCFRFHLGHYCPKDCSFKHTCFRCKVTKGQRVVPFAICKAQ